MTVTGVWAGNPRSTVMSEKKVRCFLVSVTQIQFEVKLALSYQWYRLLINKSVIKLTQFYNDE